MPFLSCLLHPSLYLSPLHCILFHLNPLSPYQLLRESYPLLSSVIKMQCRDVIAAQNQGYLWGYTEKKVLVLVCGSAYTTRNMSWADRSQMAVDREQFHMIWLPFCWLKICPPFLTVFFVELLFFFNRSITSLNMNPLWTPVNILSWLVNSSSVFIITIS